MTSRDIANALARSVFNCRRWTVLPNVSWGWGLDYEADLIAVSPNLWCDEIEIKISKSDLLADRHKRKFNGGGIDPRIKRFWYAVPDTLSQVAIESIAPAYGIIEVSAPNPTYDFPRAKKIRKAPLRTARQVTQQEFHTLLHLALVRYWDQRLTVKQGDLIEAKN